MSPSATHTLERTIRQGTHPTIYDVAARAGVSIGTVSKTLNRPTRVSEATRRRVLDAVHELDYVPKESATSRARRGTGRIGVFAPFTTHASFGERLNGVLELATETRTEVVVFDVQSAEESADVLESLPALRSLDGLIVMSTPFGDRVAAAMRRGRLPAVLVDVGGHDLPTVLSDDYEGGALAARLLLAEGRSRLAYLGHRQVLDDFDSPSRRRQRGFEATVAQLGASEQVDVVLTGSSFAEALDSAEALLRSGTPDGVFAHTDELAAAVLGAASRIGLCVPQDLSVIGFDDGPLAEALQLTTIRQPLRETGAWAARSLLQVLADPELIIPSLTLPVTLIRRQTA